MMKPTCIVYTHTYVFKSQTCGFHPTLINKLYTDETLIAEGLIFKGAGTKGHVNRGAVQKKLLA